MWGEEIRYSKVRGNLAGPVEWRAAASWLVREIEGPVDRRGQVGHEDFDGGVGPGGFWGDSRLIRGTLDVCAAEWGPAKRAKSGGRGVWGVSLGSGDVQQPVVAIHRAN